jgi:hypothetical protein
MARRKDTQTMRLRHAVEALPTHTKQGMLKGIQTNRVVVGAYTDKRGGVCPMLAAHRNGGRTNFGAFARAWDAYIGAKKPRRASAREVRTLQGYLELALVREGIRPEQPIRRESTLADAVRAVKATRRRLAEAEARESEVTVEELLAGTYAEAEQERTELIANRLLDRDIHEGPLDRSTD